MMMHDIWNFSWVRMLHKSKLRSQIPLRVQSKVFIEQPDESTGPPDGCAVEVERRYLHWFVARTISMQLCLQHTGHFIFVVEIIANRELLKN